MSNFAPNARARLRSNGASTTLDRIAFFSAFAVGTAALLGLKLVGERQLIVTAAPLAVMALYLIYVIFSRRFAVGDDRVGDNLYYLGFLFTLVSIAYSLYQFSVSNEATRDIIVNFGIALATTIAGVALRVMLMQVRGDPLEVERVARMELSEAALRLRSELDIAVQTLSEARQVNEQAITEATTRAVEETLATMTQSNSIFKDLVLQVSEKINEHFALLSDKAVALNESSTQMITATENLTQRIESIRPPSDILEKKLDGVVDKLSTVAGSLEALATGTVGVSEGLQGATNALSQHSKTLAVSANDLQHQIQELAASAGNSLRALAQDTSGVSDGLRAATAALARHSTTLAASASDLQRQVNELSVATSSSLRALATGTADASSGLQVATGALARHSGTLASSAADLQRQVAELTTATAHSLTSIGASTTSASEGLQEAANALTRHSTTLAATANDLQRQLSELARQDTGLEALTRRWTELTRLMEQQQHNATDTLGAEVQSVHRQREEIRTHVEQATQLLIQMETTLVSLARNLVERVNAV